MDGTEIKRRAEQRKSERSNIDDIWELIERFIVPWRTQIFTEKQDERQIDWRRRELYDPTAINANNSLAAHIHGALTNSALKWFSYGFKNASMKENQEAVEWLQECDSRTYQAIQESNFDLEANELYLDLTSFGNATMSSMPVEDERGGLKETDYKTFPVDECYFDFDVRGKIINFYRVLRWTTDQVIDKFGKEGLPDKITSDTKPDGSTKHKIIFCVFKREGATDEPLIQTVSVKNRPYGSKYIYWDDSSTLGEEGGHHEMAVFAPRWRRASGSQWGFSPSMVAIWDVLTLNQLVDLIMVAGEKVLDPTILTTRKGVYGDIDLSAGGTVVVQDIEKSMRAFESKARFDVSNLQKQDLIRSIEKTYFVDELKLKDSPAMTATEVNARIQLMQRLLGPTFGRLRTDFLDPVVTRQFMINFRYGMFPPPPPSITEGADLKLEYLGSLARAQRAEQVESITRWMGTAASMAQAYPGVLDNVDADSAIRELAEQDGVPAKLLKNTKDIARERKQRAEQAKAQQDAMMAQQVGEGMKAVGEGAQALGPEGTEQAAAMMKQ